MGYRLLFITHSLNNTGAPLVLLDAINACIKAGHIVDVVAMEDGPLRESMEKEEIYVTVADNFLDELSMWQGIFRRYDAVVANTLVCVEAVYALNTTEVPTLWWIHEHEYWFQYYQEILPKAADLHSNIRVYGVSPITNDFIKKYCGYETRLLPLGIRDVKEKIEKINSVDVPLTNVSAAFDGECCDDDGRNDQKVRFICPATYSQVKGQDLLCDAIRKLPDDVRRACEFIMCGATMESEDEYYATLLDAEREVKEIKILGTLPHDEALLLMSKCDYVVAPSRLEPFPTTAVEAMMLDKIPVVSSACGVTYWIKSGDNGFIFESENVEAITKALEKCVMTRLENSDTWNTIAENARDTFEKNFSLEIFSENFMKELDSCIGKKRRVLMFHREDVCYNTMNIFSDIVAGKFRERGIEVGFIDMNKTGDELADEYVREMIVGFDAALAIGSAGQHEVNMDGTSIYEYMDVPFYNWIVDHPCTCLQTIESDLKNYHIICIDRDHRSFLADNCPKLAGSHFIPLGGLENSEASFDKDSFLNREYDVSFVGSYFSLERMGEEIASLPTDFREACFCMIDYLMDNRHSTYDEACRVGFESFGMKNEVSFAEFTHLTSRVNRYMNNVVREEAVRYLVSSGVKVHLFGNGWDVLDDLGENAIVHGDVSYYESAEVFGNSKISLNVMPWFRNGFHDRIASVMLAGAAILTDSSRYIDELVSTTGDESMILFDISNPQMILELVNEMMTDKDRLYIVACNGRRLALEHFTWNKRVDDLVKILGF